jgi:hypothetical protein
MKYTPEQFTQAVLKALETLNTPDVTKLPLQERKDLAYNPNTPPEILTILAQDKDGAVRYRVAYNTNTPPEILTLLAQDKDWIVRCGVAKNPNTPQEILTILARDKDGNVANNPNATREVIQTVRAYEFYNSTK